MPENFTRQLGEFPEKSKNSKFFEIKEQQKENLIITLNFQELNRTTINDFKWQLINQIKSKWPSPSQLIFRLAKLDVRDEILGAIHFVSREILGEEISKGEKIILCGVSDDTKNRITRFGLSQKIFTIDDTKK